MTPPSRTPCPRPPAPQQIRGAAVPRSRASCPVCISSAPFVPTTATKRSPCLAPGLTHPPLGDCRTSPLLPHPPLSSSPAAASRVTGRLSRDLLTRACTSLPLLQGVRPVPAGQPYPLGLRGGLAGVRHHGHQQPLGGQPAAQPGPAAVRGDLRW